jgi:hypothetical protein
MKMTGRNIFVWHFPVISARGIFALRNTKGHRRAQSAGSKHPRANARAVSRCGVRVYRLASPLGRTSGLGQARF